MPIPRATFFFKDDNQHGWTETLFSLKPDLTATMEAARALLRLRVALLGSSAYLSYIRVSDDLIKRDSFIYQVPPGDQFQSPAHVGSADIANTSLVVRLQASPITRRTLYMRGIPDSIIVNSGMYTPGAAFSTALTMYILELINNSWACKTRIGVSPEFIISGVTQDLSNGRLEITTTAAHGYAIGDPIVISGVTGALGVNGSHAIFSVTSATSFRINSNVLMGTYSGGGKVKKLGFTLAPITSGQVIRASHRIAGRPFDSPRGRRTRRRK